MTYATLEDLVERAGESEILDVADRDGDGVADPAVIDAALVHADNIANGYIATKFTLPLASTPDLVRTWAVSIARYFLHRNSPPDYVKSDYDTAIAALKDVARGLISLSTSTGETPAATGGDYLLAAPAEVFGDNTLRGWR